MFQQGFGMTPISGNGFRPSLFGVTVEQSRTFHPTLGSGAWLGQTSSEWYERAKRSIAKYEALQGRLARVANKTERERIMSWVGSVGTQDSPAYRYNSVKSDLQTNVEAFTPPAIDAYQVERRTNRIEKLENYNSQLDSMIQNAEIVYGTLPEPVVVTKETVVNRGEEANKWTLPILVGAGALAVAGLVTLLAKKK